MLTIIGFYALMAGVFTFGKEVVLYAQPFFLTALRLPPAGAIFLVHQYLYNNAHFFFSRPVAPFLISYGVAVMCMDSFRFVALASLPASNTALIASMAPFFAAFLSYLFLEEKITKRKMIALVVGFIAIIPVLLSHISAPNAEISWSTLLVAYLAAFGSMLAFVIGGLFIKLLTTRHHVSILMVVGSGMIIGGILALFLSAHYEAWTPLPFYNMQKALPLIGYLFLTHNLIAYPLYGYLLARYPLTLIAFAQLLTPLFTAIFRWALYGEIIDIPFMISFIVLCGALYFFYTEEKKEGLIYQK